MNQKGEDRSRLMLYIRGERKSLVQELKLAQYLSSPHYPVV